MADNGQVASKNGFPVDRVANAPNIMPPASVGQRSDYEAERDIRYGDTDGLRR